MISAMMFFSVAAAASTAAAEPPPPPVGVTRRELPGAVRFDAVLPGRLLAYALPAGSGGAIEILMLVEPERETPQEAQDGKPETPDAGPCEETKKPERTPPPPRLLVRLDFAGQTGTLTTLRADLPADAVLLDSIDLDGDGIEEILLGRPGELLVLRHREGATAAAGPDLLMKDPYLLPGGDVLLEPRIIRTPALGRAPIVPLDVLGGVRFYGPGDQGRSWDLVYEAALPLEAGKKPRGLRLASPRVRLAGRRPEGRLLFASGPEAYGKQRLRSLLIDPMAQGDERRVEVWSLLPAPEEVMESRYLLLDGRPALVVATRSAEKLSLFGEKKLRLFRLDDLDRSRTGAKPLLAAESHMNLWQTMSPLARDTNEDGVDDLVIGYWKGIKDSRVVLDVYLGRKDGSYNRSPVTTDFDVERGDRSVLDYRGDLDGDGVADLLLSGAGKALVFAGTRAGRDLVGKKPGLMVEISDGGEGRKREVDQQFELAFGGDGGGRGGGGYDPLAGGRGGAPRAMDLDHDGRAELLVAWPLVQGRGLLQVIRSVPR